MVLEQQGTPTDHSHCRERGVLYCPGKLWDQHMQAATDKFEYKELEAWEKMKMENTMKGNGTTLFEMGAV